MGASPGQLAKYSSAPRPAPAPAPAVAPAASPVRSTPSAGVPAAPAPAPSGGPTRMAAVPSQNTAADRYQAAQQSRQNQLNQRRQALGLGSIALPTPAGLQAPTPASGFAPGGAQAATGQVTAYFPSTPAPSPTPATKPPGT